MDTGHRRRGESVSDARLQEIVDTVGREVPTWEVARLAAELLARKAVGAWVPRMVDIDRVSEIVDKVGEGVPGWEVAAIAAELRHRRGTGCRMPSLH